MLGGYRHGGDYNVMSNTRRFPRTTEVLIAYLLQSAKPFVLLHCIAVPSNLCTDLCTAIHRDFNTVDYPNLLCPISEVAGGALWCQSSDGSVIALSPGLGIARSWLRMRALTFRACAMLLFSSFSIWVCLWPACGHAGYRQSPPTRNSASLRASLFPTLPYYPRFAGVSSEG